MKTTFLKVATDDNLVLHGLFYEPETDSKGAILYIHGMAGNFYESKFLDVMAKVLTDAGWSFLTVNTRGHDFISEILVDGKKEGYKRIGNSYEMFEECVLDIKAWIDWLAERGVENIILEGHSLGGPKVVHYLAETQDSRVKRLILMSPADMVGLAEQEDYHQKLLSEAKVLVEKGEGKKILSRQLWDYYPLSANTYLNFFTKDNPIDVFNTFDKDKPSSLAKISIPILAFFGEKDDSVILPIVEVLNIIKSKAINAPIFDTEIIGNAPHSYFGAEEDMVRIILNWINI